MSKVSCLSVSVGGSGIFEMGNTSESLFRERGTVPKTRLVLTKAL